MEIRVKLSGDLCKYFEEEKRFQMEAPVTIGELLDHLSIEEGEVGVIALNGKLSTKSKELQDGDRVEFFPPIGGG